MKLQHHFVLPIASEIIENLSNTLKNIKPSIFSLYSKAKHLKLRTISIATTPDGSNIS